MTEPAPIEVHKALADDTRYRLYRYLRLSGRPVSVRELSDAAVAAPEHAAAAPAAPGGGGPGRERGPARVGRRWAGRRCCTRPIDREDREGRDYRLLADILAGLLDDAAPARASRRARARLGRLPGGPERPAAGRAAARRARTSPCCRRRSPMPGSSRGSAGGARRTVEITLRDCPFRDLLDEHRELVCAVHRGLLEGMLGASRPADALTEFEPLAERSTVCRIVAAGA